MLHQSVDSKHSELSGQVLTLREVKYVVDIVSSGRCYLMA